MPTGVELATAYVSLIVEGSKLGKGARKIGEKAGRDYQQAFNDSAESGPAPDPGKGAEKKSRTSGEKAGDAYASAFDRRSGPR